MLQDTKHFFSLKPIFTVPGQFELSLVESVLHVVRCMSESVPCSRVIMILILIAI